MPLFWEKIGAVGKMSWIAMLFIMLATEYRAIDKAQNDSDLAQQKSLTAIGDGFKAVIRESSEDFKRTSEQASAQFEATMNRSNLLVNGVRKSIEAQTGGNSYVVVAPVYSKDDDLELHLGIIACATCTDSIPSAHIFMNMVYPTQEKDSLIFEGQIDPGYYQYGTKTITPFTVGESTYAIRVYARNKPTTEVLSIRFNYIQQIWEYSYRVAREMKRPHYNPKTKLAEGLVATQLEYQPWISSHMTTVDPKHMKLNH